MCRIEEAAPILTDGSTHIKFRSGTPQTPIRNKNGFVSTDELHQRSKKTSQGLLPQVNAPTSKCLLKARSVPNSPLHFLPHFLHWSHSSLRRWLLLTCSEKPAHYDTQSVCSIRSIAPWLHILSQINLIYNNINSQLDATIMVFVNNRNQLNMFRTMISPILRSTRLCLQLVI